MGRLYSYVVQHDLGFAPNPFWGACTLANCKPQIRRLANVGDVIVGTGSTDIAARGRLVYWMRVGEILSFDEYWSDPRFLCKRPNMRGAAMHRYGDNIYWRGDDGAYEQLDSFHSESDGTLSAPNVERDTGSTDKVLIGAEFAYFGKSAPAIPKALQFAVKRGPGHRSVFNDDHQIAVTMWLTGLPGRGYLGEPGRW